MTPNEVLSPLFVKVLRPNAATLAGMFAKGAIAVAVYKPGALAQQALRGLVGTAPSPSSRCPARLRRSFAAAGTTLNNTVTAAWLQSGRRGRVFAFVEEGTILLNVGPDGWAIEPGSTERAGLS